MLKDKIVVVTGGNGLLGRSFCNEIIKNGGLPIVADLSKEGEEFASTLMGADFFRLNITSKDSINDLIKYLDQKYGRIDAVVNNAYPRNENYGKHFFEIEYSDFVENVGMNLGGYFLTSQQFAEYYVNQGFGNIINISSIYGVIAPRFEIYKGTIMTTPVEYAAIKSALIHLTKYMAKYFKGKNIRVNTISLGGILDNQPNTFIEKYKQYTLNKGMLDSSDISGTLSFLLSDLSEYVNGQNIIVDDGWTL
jgi:NAD(P)-dependent dehydrogenase (short-subunit alcohol dehydrogenase family)